MKSEEIVDEVFRHHRTREIPAWGAGMIQPNEDQFREMAIEAVNVAVARAVVDLERAARLRDGQVRFTVEFDPEVWPTLTPAQQQDWINDAHNALAEDTHIILEEVGR